MTRDDLVTQLAAIQRTLDNRITVVRIVIDEQGHELHRITRSTHRPRPRTNDTQAKERTYD